MAPWGIGARLVFGGLAYLSVMYITPLDSLDAISKQKRIIGLQLAHVRLLKIFSFSTRNWPHNCHIMFLTMRMLRFPRMLVEKYGKLPGSV